MSRSSPTPADDDDPRSLASRIGRSTLVLIAIAAGTKALGYVEKVVIASTFGADARVDAYFVAVKTVLLIFLFARELLEAPFLPVFVRERESGGERRAWGLFSFVALALVGLGAAAAMTIFVFPDAVARRAPGMGAEGLETCARLLHLMAPAVVLLLLSALTGITLNAYRRFAAPAAGDLALKLGPIVAIVWLSPQLGIEALALGFVAGGALRLGTHVLGLGRRLRLAHLPTADGRDARWRMGKLMLPLLLGSTFAQLAELGDDYFASLVGAGGVSARTFAKSLRDLPLEVLPYALSVVLFPYFAALDASGRAAELRRLFGRTAHGLAIAFAALSVVMIVFAEPIVSLALERGRFGVEQRLLTVGPLRMFGLGMVAFAVETVLVNYFFARQNTLTPILCGMLAVGVNLTLCALLVGPMGVSGVALALTIAKSFKVVLLGWLLVRGDHGAALACVFALLRLLPSTALSTAACLGYAHVWPVDLGTAPALAKLLHLLGGAAVGGTVFFASLFVLSPRERPLLAAIPSLVRRVLGSAMRNVRR